MKRGNESSDATGGTREGKRSVHCPYCRKKMAETLEGRAEFTCPRCRRTFRVVMTA